MRITKVISERGLTFPKYKNHMDSKHFMRYISFYICKELEERDSSILVYICHKITHNVSTLYNINAYGVVSKTKAPSIKWTK